VQDGLQPFSCPTCSRLRAGDEEALQQIQDRALVVARKLSTAVPSNPLYRCVPHDCWRCDEEMLVYVWPGGGDHTPRRPPTPIPATVRHRVTEGAGDYWANCCPSCSAVQGDYYLARDNRDYARVRELTQRTYSWHSEDH
jgi:hypothetical protein